MQNFIFICGTKMDRPLKNTVRIKAEFRRQTIFDKIVFQISRNFFCSTKLLIFKTKISSFPEFGILHKCQYRLQLNWLQFKVNNWTWSNMLLKCLLYFTFFCKIVTQKNNHSKNNNFLRRPWRPKSPFFPIAVIYQPRYITKRSFLSAVYKHSWQGLFLSTVGKRGGPSTVFLQARYITERRIFLPSPVCKQSILLSAVYCKAQLKSAVFFRPQYFSEHSILTRTVYPMKSAEFQ